jgi:hypothetical protein
MNIYVGSLNFKMQESELKELFEAYGEVASAKIIFDKYSGKSKGFGFVEMPNDAEALAVGTLSLMNRSKDLKEKISEAVITTTAEEEMITGRT